MKTLKYAWRFLMRSKSYTVINLLGLAFSLACCIILMRYIHRELTVDAHCIDAENLYMPLRDIEGNVFPCNSQQGVDTAFYTNDMVKERARFITMGLNNISVDDKPYSAHILVTDSMFFHLFKYPLYTGEIKLKAPDDVLITKEFAERTFGNQNPIGRSIKYTNGKNLTVCGVLDEPTCKTSITFDVVMNFDYSTNWSRLHGEIVRFMPGVDVDAINAVTNVYRESADLKAKVRYHIIPFREFYWNTEISDRDEAASMMHYGSRSHIYMLLAVFCLLLFAGILNFVNLYMVSMLKRSKEYGLKKVFGAQGYKLFIQLWMENMLMVTIALFLVWLIIEISAGYVNQLLGSAISYTSFDWQLSLGIWALLPLVTSFYPYLKYNYRPPVQSIHSIGTGKQSVVTRTLFLFVQYSITSLLIIVSLYFGKQLYFLQETPPGYRTEGILYPNLIHESKDWGSYTQEDMMARIGRIKMIDKKLDECPFIQHWGISVSKILDNGNYITLVNDKDTKINMMTLWVNPDFFKIYDIPLLEGVLPDEIKDYSKQLIVLNEAAMKAFGYTRCEDAFLRGENALWVSMSQNGPTEYGKELMPVTATVKDYYQGHLTSGKKPIAFFVGRNQSDKYQIVCQQGKEQELLDYLKKLEKEIYNNDYFEYSWLKDEIKELYRRDRQVTIVYISFAVISIFISCLGLFGLSLFDIRQRYREIAIRKVNGAGMRDLYLLLFRKYVLVLVGAFALAVPLSYYLIYMYTRDFVVKAPIGIGIFVIALLIVMLISLGTLMWQIRKAANIDPAKIMKSE